MSEAIIREILNEMNRIYGKEPINLHDAVTDFFIVFARETEIARIMGWFGVDTPQTTEGEYQDHARVFKLLTSIEIQEQDVKNMMTAAKYTIFSFDDIYHRLVRIANRGSIDLRDSEMLIGIGIPASKITLLFLANK